MPEAFLGDGLIFEEALPVVWTAGPLAEGLALEASHAGDAVELLVQALNKTADPQERFLTVPLSFPSLDELRASPAVKNQALSATV